MAKQTAKRSSSGRRRTSQSRSSQSIPRNSHRQSGFFDKLKEFYDNPTVRYIAAGMATAALTKTVQNMAERYPEITKLLEETLDSLEEKLVEFKEAASGSGIRIKDDTRVEH